MSNLSDYGYNGNLLGASHRERVDADLSILFPPLNFAPLEFIKCRQIL
jgi:hypothetical protein